jgi:hypothetical protein
MQRISKKWRKTMFNDDKKLVTDINRGKDIDTNLPKFADAVMLADYEYACQKLTLNYVTLREMLDDKDLADDPYIYECVTGINKLVGKYIVSGENQVSDKDRQLINNLRNTITGKMKILTSYTDAFEIYEYILNRREFNFEENIDEELEEIFTSFDPEAFSNEVFNYIFQDNDSVVVNSKIQQAVGQLPLRMTKVKFFDIIGQTLSIYNGCEIGSLENFARTVEETALIHTPENFETEYSGLFDALTMFRGGDYAHLDYESYRTLSTVLDNSSVFINQVVSDYMMLIEIVNDLYSIMLTNDVKDTVSDKCKKARRIITIIYESMGEGLSFPEDSFELLVANEGAQEEAGEHKVLLETYFYDIVSTNHEDIERLSLSDRFDSLEIVNKLLSGSMFIDIDSVEEYDTTPADTEYIVGLKDKLINELTELFDRNSQIINRAVMAKILSNIPVFFNSQQEVKEYIDNSISRCSNRSEVLACYMVIQNMMQE